MGVNINFLADYKEMISQELSKLGYPPEPEEDLDTVLIRYLNIQRRIPPVLAWTVKQSGELATKSLPQPITVGLQQFIQKAQSGESLKPHLSTNMDDPDYKDLMFYDWGVFHFHLGTSPHPTKSEYVARTKELLYAIADSTTAVMYLIDILNHKFTNQDLLRIIEENWPEILDVYSLPGVIELDHSASNEDIGILRKAGVNTMLQTPGGRFLVPMGGGITTAGTSVSNRVEANTHISNVHQLQENFIKRKAFLEHTFKSKYGKDWDHLTFKVKSFQNPVKIEEITTGLVLEFS